MRYLKIKRCDGIYDFVPLEVTTFGFIEVDEHEYRVEITLGGKTIATLFEKIYISDVDEFMLKIASLYDGEIITPESLL